MLQLKKCSSDQLMILPTGRTSICLSVLLASAVQHLLLNAKFALIKANEKHGLYQSTVKAVAMLDLDVLPLCCGFRETPNIVDKLVPVKPNLLVYINLFRIRQVDMAEK